ncbi:MAG: hypothetical protein QGF09_10390 [Rhodospirillales bacterium]|nr:hypothetical protein [Rhodospirillales bacterium]
MEKDFAETVNNEPELLAHHFSEAGRAGEGAAYWQKAAQRAAGRWASAEAVGHIRLGLEQIATLPNDAERAVSEISMLIDLVAGLKDAMDAAMLAEREGNRRAEMVARGSCAGRILFDMADHGRPGSKSAGRWNFPDSWAPSVSSLSIMSSWPISRRSRATGMKRWPWPKKWWWSAARPAPNSADP